MRLPRVPLERLPRISPARYRQITGMTLVALGFIVVTGAAVRLTGSGLGCSQWPTCENDRIIAPLDFHPMVEFGNRMVTGAVSVAVILAVLGSLVRSPRRRDLIGLSFVLALGIPLEAVVGGISVHMELTPGMIAVHFLLSFVLLAAGVVLHHRAGTGDGAASPVVDRTTIRLSRVMVALSVAVLVAGTFVTGTGPHAGDERAPRYTFATITDVTRAHSLVAWAFLLVALVILGRLARSGAPAAVDAAGRRLVAAIVLQGAIGYAQYFAKLPPYLVLLHVLGSVLVFLAAVDFHLGLVARSEEREVAAAPTGPAPTPAEPASGPLAPV